MKAFLMYPEDGGSCGQRAARFTITTGDEARLSAGPDWSRGPGNGGPAVPLMALAPVWLRQ